jgi:hypothetical protein
MSARQPTRPERLRSSARAWPAWGVIGAAVAGAVLIVTAAARPAPVVRSDAAAHAMPSAMAACERTSRVCDPAALRAYPLTSPMAHGARLLTEQQVVARYGGGGDIVRARLMTYRQAATAFPALAASAVIDRSREVWVLTRYYPKPVTVPFAGGYGPPGEPATEQISAVSVVIDATTGTVTDSCLGCAVIPRSG